MASEETAVLSNVILVILLVAIVVLGSFWVYRQMDAGEDRGTGIEVNLGGGNSGSNGY